jgi:hypothetical protein
MVRNLVRSLRLWLAPVALWMASAPVHAQDMFNGWGGAGCGTCSLTYGCQTHHCPPALSHCQEGPPKIRVRCGCPKPICNPCTQPGWGYYETCWSPWPWPPNYGHCLTVPPAATIALSGPYNPNAPNAPYGPGATPEPSTRTLPAPIAPSMPPVTAPSVPTTPAMPRITPSPGPGAAIPQSNQPLNAADLLPTPRTEFPPPARPVPPN